MATAECTVNKDRGKVLADIVEECRKGRYPWEDGAWAFIYNITETGDAALFHIAPDEIRQEIFRRIGRLREDGHYRVRARGVVDEVDHTERMHRLVDLLDGAGLLGKA